MDFKDSLHPLFYLGQAVRTRYWGAIVLCTQTPSSLLKILKYRIRNKRMLHDGCFAESTMQWKYELSIRISLPHRLISVTWRTRPWRSGWQPTTAAGVWAGAHIAVLCCIAVMPTMTIWCRSGYSAIVHSAICSCIKCRSPVIASWTICPWAWAVLCNVIQEFKGH